MAGPLRAALADRPVVLVNGARQVGKSTLVQELAQHEDPPRQYLTLDDAAVLSAALNDPTGFVAGLDGPVALDEVQRAPDLFFALKAAVDRDRRPGRFLLTGSADVLLLPRVASALTGRMEVLTLWPLSQGELEGAPDGFVDAVFAERLPALAPETRASADIATRIQRGGFPELVRPGARVEVRRDRWFGSYLLTLLQRDVRDFAQIEDLAALPRLLALLAARPMGLLNYADLARMSGLAQTTTKRYMALLEATFLVRSLPAWFVNIGKRLAKAPKIFLADSGLTTYLQGADATRASALRHELGFLLEAFVAAELEKQLGWSAQRVRLFHFRTSDGHEVDFVLESATGAVVGIEVKAAATVGPADLKGLRLLAEAAGPRFVRGMVLYTGTAVVPFAANVHAVPIRALWRWRAAGG